MMVYSNINLIKSIILVLIFTSLVQSESKIIKNYVNKFDSHYKWTLNASYGVDYGTIYVLELTSQQWMKDYSDNSIWKHWLTICKPNDYVQNPQEAAILHMTDGMNQDWTVPSLDKVKNPSFYQNLCRSSNSIVATLFQVPNQFITFNNDGIPRQEDDIVAYTWRRCMDSNDQTWLSLLPQTKSAIKAMDAVQEFGKSTSLYKVSKFLVNGASKRGWTTFGTAMAQDKRVIAIAPMVIPVLNLVKNIEAQKQAYGEWSFALQSYIDQNITTFFQTEYFNQVTDIVDPLNLVNTMENVAKFIMVTTGDEFFLPDSPKNFFSQLKGEKRLGIYQTNHGITTFADASAEVSKYFKLISNSQERPQLDWNIVYSADKKAGTINMNIVKGTATKVVIWSADTISTTKRDFRKFKCTTTFEECFQNITWVSTSIDLSDSKSYSFTLSKPTAGWTGFYFEVEFSTIATIQSEIAVIPDVYPFASCSKAECGSGVPEPSSANNFKSLINLLIVFTLCFSLFLI